MRSLRVLVLVLVLVPLLTAAAACGTEPNASLTGHWASREGCGGRVGRGTLTLTQRGDSVTGLFDGTECGGDTVAVAGWARGGQVRLVIPADPYMDVWEADFRDGDAITFVIRSDLWYNLKESRGFRRVR